VSGRVVGGREYVAEITNVSLSGQRMGRPFAGGREEISIWVAVLLHEWVEVGSSVLAIVPQLSLHVDVEAVGALLETPNDPLHKNWSIGIRLFEAYLSSHSTLAARSQEYSCRHGFGKSETIGEKWPSVLGGYCWECKRPAIKASVVDGVSIEWQQQ
jgi:hypothetical protein